MAIFKFTEARLRDLPLGSGIHRDTEVKGLMCIAHKTTKTFAVQGDVRRDKRLVRSVRVKIGRTDLVRLAEARNEARRLMATIQSGVDPTAGPESKGITLEQALREHLRERDLSDATERNYRYHMDNYLGRLRRRAVADITRQDCRELMEQLTRRHGKTTGASVNSPVDVRKAAATNRQAAERQLDELAKQMQQPGETFHKAYDRALNTDMGKALMRTRDDAQELERGGVTSMGLADARKNLMEG